MNEPSPLHAQISDMLRAKIDSGAWPPHYKLRAEPDLAVELGVSRGTVRRALRTLIDEGRLVQVHGRGTFVSGTTIEPAIAQQMLSLSEALSRQGVPFDSEVDSAGIETTREHVTGLLDIPSGAPTFVLSRRYLVNGEPVARLVNYVRVDLCPGIDEIDFTHKRLFGVLEGEFGLLLRSGRRTFAAQGAPPEVAIALTIADGSPVLYLEQVTYLEDGRPVEYSDVWIRGDRLKLSALLMRDSR